MDLRIETPRFVMRPFTIDDADLLFELDSDATVMRYIGSPPVREMSESRAMVQYILDQYERNGLGRLVVESKETGAFVGWSGLKFVEETINGKTNYYDVGFRLLPRFWGMGIGSEVGQASVNFGFKTLKISKICATVMDGNIGSKTVLERIGLSYINTFREPQFGENDIFWYEGLNPNL